MKHFSFVAIDVRPLSQNDRPKAKLKILRSELVGAYNKKYPLNKMPLNILLNTPLEAKVFYIHKIRDRFDADNISKPLWDALQGQAYNNDYIIKYLETLKIHFNSTPDRLEFDVSNMDDQDLEDLINFIYDHPQPKDRLLYIALSEYKSKNVRLI
ncbi:RusA family crossover junction endodeoxyribonuclease [Belliella sp. DSM 107340]|uniref:RusA family crossover junction endodeoxyribonuclease n=1 Tax=Belliella calami TaxID=2923436 RepID=A0ABS9UK45_9BACT|nr:RusA family crossover junction endodeoxyribonuclease [Belliella calami]MCH7396729.1 RusA family crossover junction endodeoxyribonuclease [Belliella calami]